jgi:hypothetical protein
VAATEKAVADSKQPSSGDRIRVVGYDTEHSEHAYSQLPDEYLSYPGEAVTSIDGEDVSDRFEAFIHAPFKDDCAAARNDTSLALQVTLTDEDGDAGHVLLLGDLAYETIRKIFTFSEANGRPERLTWEVLLAPHHCSKKVMYVPEDGKDVLKQDVLNLFEAHSVGAATIVVSSAAFPASNKSGDNPPHVIARERYEEIAADLVCSGEYPDADSPRPIVFGMDETGFALLEPETTESVSKSASSRGAKGLGLLAALAATAVVGEHLRRKQDAARGLDQVRRGVTAARGTDAAPQQAVGFGSR